MQAFWASGPQHTSMEVEAPQTASGPNSMQSALVVQFPQNEPETGGPAQKVAPSVVCLHEQLKLPPQGKFSPVAQASAPGAQPPGGTTQALPTHSSVSSQVAPQAPQLLLLRVRLTQSPSQQRSPLAHWLLQPPQWFLSLSRFLQSPPQSRKPPRQRHLLPGHSAWAQQSWFLSHRRPTFLQAAAA